MRYPSLEQYTNAMQRPDLALVDPELKGGKVVKSGLGLPRALCGGFALTYTLNVASKTYAVRCFHKEANHLEARYGAISDRLKALRSQYFIEFEFQPQGVRVEGQKFPIVKMAWASGVTLGEFMARCHRDKQALLRLRESLRRLAVFLEGERIAHGDIQPGNLMVADEGRTIQLIDYDGMFVEALQMLGSNELGLRNFQHPSRHSSTWDYRLDRFSFIQLYLSLGVLAAQPDLWLTTQSDENSILFKVQDFLDPGRSRIFQSLFKTKEFETDAKNFAAICKSPSDKIPSLEEFIQGKKIPAANITVSSPATPQWQPYLGAYPVVDAKNYDLCATRVGDRVELVGCIVDVKAGTTKYGSPYVFLNFADWRGEATKITIWAEALSTFSKKPDQAWVGKWISVVGLLEPPFEKSVYSHIAITITDANQIHKIPAEEAKFRLEGASESQLDSPSQIRNSDVLSNVRKAGRLNKQHAPQHAPSSKPWPANPLPPPVIPPVTTAVPSRTKNQTILQNMKVQKTATGARPTGTPVLTKKPAQSTPTSSRKPPNKADTSWQRKGVLVGILSFALLILASDYLYPFLFQASSASTPSSIPPSRSTIPVTRTPAPVEPVAPAVTEDACIAWDQIDLALKGEWICAYGRVDSRRYFMENDEFSYVLIRFNQDVQSFYLISRSRSLIVAPGECIRVEASVEYDLNGVPFMEVSELSQSELSCSP